MGVAIPGRTHDAFVYGSGPEKGGFILTRKWDPMKLDAKGRKLQGPVFRRGQESKEAFLRALPAMKKLIEAVQVLAKERGFLWGLDGRKIPVRSQHAALNTLLQGAGAAQMKRALCILDDSLQALGLVPGVNYEFVANVHDEWQIEVDEQHAELVGKTAVEAIRLAGESFSFRCPLAGAYGIGKSWADTH